MSYSDFIDSLPLDPQPPTPEESEILNTVLQKKRGMISKIIYQSREYILLYFLLLLFAHPVSDKIICNVWTVPSSKYAVVIFKAFLFTVLYAVLSKALMRGERD